jgi:hypothetical protein
VSVGIVSLALALLMPRAELAWSGWVYLSIAILVLVYSMYRKGSMAKALREKL